MLSWGVIAYGAALSAVAASGLVGFAGRERRPAVLACAAVSAVLGAVGWNAILHATHADQFFHDAPIPVFPISWQDTGSGVFSVARRHGAAGVRTPTRQPIPPTRIAGCPDGSWGAARRHLSVLNPCIPPKSS